MVWVYTHIRGGLIAAAWDMDFAEKVQEHPHPCSVSSSGSLCNH